MDASIFDSALSHTRRSDASEKREENSVSTFGRFRLWTSFESSPVSVKSVLEMILMTLSEFSKFRTPTVNSCCVVVIISRPNIGWPNLKSSRKKTFREFSQVRFETILSLQLEILNLPDGLSVVSPGMHKSALTVVFCTKMRSKGLFKFEIHKNFYLNSIFIDHSE